MGGLGGPPPPGGGPPRGNPCAIYSTWSLFDPWFCTRILGFACCKRWRVGGVAILGCQIATVQRFRLFAKAVVQEVQLAILAAARSQVRHFCLAALRPAALQPAACSLAVRNLLPAALPAALQCATCCLQPCSAQPAACSLAACSLAASCLQPACSLSVQHFGLFASAALKSN